VVSLPPVPTAVATALPTVAKQRYLAMGAALPRTGGLGLGVLAELAVVLVSGGLLLRSASKKRD
jgi:hypothetical protein